MAPSARRDWTLESDGSEEERNFRVCFDNTVYMERKLVSFSWHLNQDELLKYAKADQIERKLIKRIKDQVRQGKFVLSMQTEEKGDHSDGKKTHIKMSSMKVSLA